MPHRAEEEERTTKPRRTNCIGPLPRNARDHREHLRNKEGEVEVHKRVELEKGKNKKVEEEKGQETGQEKEEKREEEKEKERKEKN